MAKTRDTFVVAETNKGTCQKKTKADCIHRTRHCRAQLAVYLLLLLTAFVMQLASANISYQSTRRKRNAPIDYYKTSVDPRPRRQATDRRNPILASANIPETLHFAKLNSRRGQRVQVCPQKCRCSPNLEARCAFRLLTTVPAGLPRDLQRLNLAYNKFTSLPPNAFADVASELKFLFLQSNNIHRLPGAFTNLTKVEVLRLSWNKLTAVRKLTFSDLVSLKRLYLDNNRLTFIHPGSLRGITNLRLLQLEGNRLTQLHPDTFVTLRFKRYFSYSHIQYLYLSNNLFQVLPRSLFTGISNLRQVYLNGNPWECTCHLQWLHQWMRESGKYRCKQSVLRRGDPPSCALCASPAYLRGQVVTHVSQDNMTCHSPRTTDYDDFTSSLNFQEDPSLMEIHNEKALFNFGATQHPSMSLRIDGRVGSLVLMNCHATHEPETSVVANNQDDESYLGHLELMMMCSVVYPKQQEKLDSIIRPYLNSALNFSAFENQDIDTSQAINYQVALQGEPLTPLSSPGQGLRINAASILSDFDVFKAHHATVTMYGHQFRPEENRLGLLFQAKILHRFSGNDFDRDFPWTKAGDPSPLLMKTYVAIEGQTTVLKCRAMGFPKPELSWISPSEMLIRPMSHLRKFKLNRSGRLMIETAAVNDSGIYRCLSQSRSRGDQAAIATAEAIGAVRLFVIPKLYDELPSQRQQVTIEQGQDWMLPCAMEGVPSPVIAWVTPDNLLFVYGRRSANPGISINENGTLTIDNVQSANEGLYRCIAANRVGIKVYSIYLTVAETLQPVTYLSPAMPVNFLTMSPLALSEAIDEQSDTPIQIQKSTTDMLIRAGVLTMASRYDANETTKSLKTNSLEQATKVDTNSSENNSILLKLTPQTSLSMKPLFQEDIATISPTNAPATTTNEASSGRPMTEIEETAAEILLQKSKLWKQSINATSFEEHSSSDNLDSSKDLPLREFVKIQNKENLLAPPEFDVQLISKTEQHIPTNHKKKYSINTKPNASSVELTEDNATTLPSNQTIAVYELSTSPRTELTSTTEDAKYISEVSKPTVTRPSPALLDEPEGKSQRRKSDIRPRLDVNEHQQRPSFAIKHSQRLVRVEYNNSLEIRCPIEEGLKTSWKYYPRSRRSLRQGRGRIFGVFTPDSAFPGVVFQGSNTILITGATSVHNGTFLCRGPHRQMHRTHVVVIWKKPYFITPHFTGITVEYGKSLTIPCIAKGIPEPKIMWSWPMSDSMTSQDSTTQIYTESRNVLHIDNVTTEYGISYLCIASNAAGEASRSLAITVSSMAPKISSSTNLVNAQIGDSVMLSCEVLGIPEPKWEWIFPNGDHSIFTNQTSSRIRTYSNRSLMISFLLEEDHGTYRCKASNAIGEEEIGVTVNVIASSMSSQAPREEVLSNQRRETIITIPPVFPVSTTTFATSKISTKAETAAAMPTLESLERDNPQTTGAESQITATDKPVQSAKENVMIATTATATTFTTTPKYLAAKAPQSSSTTTLVTTTEAVVVPAAESISQETVESNETTSKEFDENELEEKFVRDYTIKKYVRPSETVFMSCRTHFPRDMRQQYQTYRRQSSKHFRNPYVAKRWTTPSGDPASFPAQVPSWRHRVFMNGTLRISNVMFLDKGLYVCVAEDSHGRKIRTSVYLRIATQPPILSQPSHERVQVNNGRAAWAPCAAQGYPEPRITWKTPDGRTYARGSYGTGLRVQQSGRLLIYSVDSTSAGTYVCTASNVAGNISRVVLFKVRNVAPRIRAVRSITQHVRLGGSVRLTCPAVGVPEPNQYWTLPQGKSISKNEGIFEPGSSRSKFFMMPSGTLTLRRATRSDAGYYRCHVKNRLGSDTKTVNLKVNVYS